MKQQKSTGSGDICGLCKKRPRKTHWCSKWCGPCSRELIKAPRSTLSPAQIAKAEKLIGKMPREEIASKLGVSLSNLKRAFRGRRPLWFQNGKFKNNPALVQSVLRYYEAHGRPKTEKKFPHIKVRSIIERANYYGFKLKPRQTRWTVDQIKLAVQMAAAGVPYEKQAKIFNRPNANAGSIRSFWVKRRAGASSGNYLHGMPKWIAREFLKPGFPTHKVGHLNLVYWCEMSPWLLPETPDFLRDAIEALADFQQWIFGGNPLKVIRKFRNES